MSARLQIQAKSGLTSALSFTPVRPGLVQRHSENWEERVTVPPIVHKVLRLPGQPLDVDTRTFTESRFGRDFSQVSVRTAAPMLLQPKLTIGQPGDKYEQEADRVADLVMRVPEPDTPEETMVSRQVQGIRIQRACTECDDELRRQPLDEEEEEEEEDILRAKEVPGPTPQVTPGLAGQINSLQGRGRPLPESVRAVFELRFGYDFSRVRVHTDAKAAESARAVNARAYTVGHDIVFGSGQYAPGTVASKRLLSHELTHVVQQHHAAAVDRLTLDNPAEPAQQEADHIASNLGVANVMETASRSIQREPEPPFEDPLARQVGPFEERPLPPRCSIIYEKGKWSWKCEDLPGLGSTPKIPLDPRDIPGEIKDLFRKKGDDKKGAVPVFPKPGGGLPPDWLEKLCQRDPLSPICVLPGKKGKKGTDLTKPIGVFWTTDVHFEQNRPSPGEPSSAGGLTAAGSEALDTIIFMLKLDPTLQVRLIGKASSEGSDAYNLELSKRRAQFVFQKLKEAGLDLQVMDPLKSDGKDAGCTGLQFGVWACGELGATQDEVRPQDRKVEATFLRNPPLPRGPLRLNLPQFGQSRME